MKCHQSESKKTMRRILFSILLFSLLWDGSLPSAQTAPDNENSFRLITQDNLWFSGPPTYGNYKINGKSMIPVMPLLGFTNSWDRRVKAQELQWLLRYTSRQGSGLIISQEWIKPNDGIDSFIQNPFLPLIEQHGGNLLWNIFYDPVLAALQRNLITAPPIDFKNPAIRQMWEGDLKHLRQLYFNHPQYWKIKGKPVLYIWNVPCLVNADAAFTKARKEGIYLLGDVMHSQVNNPSYMDSLPPLDCATGFLVVIDILAFAETTIGEIIPTFAKLYKDWNLEAGKRNMSFIPAGSCQYDDTEFAALIGKAPTRILAKNRTEVEDYLKTALSEAMAIDGTRYIFWGTANNWAEGTTILPTKLVAPSQQFYVQRRLNGKPVKRIGQYGFEHLKAVKKILFPREKSYTGPIVKTGQPVLIRTTATEKVYRVKVTLSDCDRMGALSTSTSKGIILLNPPDFKDLKNIIELKGFRYQWNAEVSVAITQDSVSSWTLWIKFINLDKKETRCRVDFN
jgi:hypothetical protein